VRLCVTLGDILWDIVGHIVGHISRDLSQEETECARVCLVSSVSHSGAAQVSSPVGCIAVSVGHNGPRRDLFFS
jgi:hypothetical protein